MNEKYEVHWYDCHGHSYSTAEGWKELHELVAWLESKGAVITGIIRV
jgi:hypothetical protein